MKNKYISFIQIIFFTVACVYPAYLLIRRKNIIDISILIFIVLISVIGDFIECIALIELSKVLASFFLIAIYVNCYHIYFKHSKSNIDSISFKAIDNKMGYLIFSSETICYFLPLKISSHFNMLWFYGYLKAITMHHQNRK
uniref:Uncharacterized protein n=1 Tax=Providencia rettgeri TaxID=587 RepID=A0A1V0M7E0_PRORE|nr:hypothetical protein pC131_00041 [Providencia rettgeri]